eukprot:COSAG05_NODE_1419_length_4930_cov_4.794866_8_plen_61_part_01
MPSRPGCLIYAPPYNVGMGVIYMCRKGGLYVCVCVCACVCVLSSTTFFVIAERLVNANTFV